MSESVLIVDDHAGFRASARRMLEAEGYDVIGEASDGTQGLSAAAELEPDVVLLDVQLPDIGGAEVARRLTAAGSGAVVILISTRTRADLGPRVAQCGADGFITKADLTGAAVTGLLAENRSQPPQDHPDGAGEGSNGAPGQASPAHSRPATDGGAPR